MVPLCTFSRIRLSTFARTPTAGATLREQWAAIALELAGHVAAIDYDAVNG
jgi:hypothetical protein